MTKTASRTDPDEPVEYFDDRNSGVRQLTPRATAAAPASRLSMAWVSRRLKWLLVVGLAWGFAFGLSLGLVIRSPRREVAVDRSTSRQRALSSQTVVAALVATPTPRAAPEPPAVTPPTPALPTSPPPTPAAPSTPTIADASPEQSADALRVAAPGRSEWRDAALDVVEHHHRRVNDCVRHARARGALTPGRVRVTVVVSSDGSVRNVGWGEAEPSQVRALGCITSAVRRWTFPSFEGEPFRSLGVNFELR